MKIRSNKQCPWKLSSAHFKKCWFMSDNWLSRKRKKKKNDEQYISISVL